MSKRSDPKAFARAPGACEPAAADSARFADPPAVPLPGLAPPAAGALATRAPPDATLLVAEANDGASSLTPYIDANGFDPADYKWVPVRRRPRKDGWSEAKQRRFIEVLADTACVEQAARAVGQSVRSAYTLRRAPGGEEFAAAWDAAIHQGALKLVDIAFDRAIHGSDEPVFDRDGNRVGRRMRQNDRLLMFLLRAHLPGRYRHAHRDARLPGELLPPDTPSLAEAIARLEPAAPSDAHRLMPPEDLDVEIEVADLADGELPHWYREDVLETPAGPVLGEAFERELEAAKRAASGLGTWDEEDADDEPFD